MCSLRREVFEGGRVVDGEFFRKWGGVERGEAGPLIVVWRGGIGMLMSGRSAC